MLLGAYPELTGESVPAWEITGSAAQARSHSLHRGVRGGGKCVFATKAFHRPLKTGAERQFLLR